jgi:fructose-1,6-bisphosphatase/inositol monophosphatase family enzyme
MTRKAIPIRRFGSAAIDLAYVAAGRFDAYWEVSLQPWDFAEANSLSRKLAVKSLNTTARLAIRLNPVLF